MNIKALIGERPVVGVKPRVTRSAPPPEPDEHALHETVARREIVEISPEGRVRSARASGEQYPPNEDGEQS